VAVRYTFTQKHCIEQNKLGRVLAVPRSCELYPGICITTDEKALKTLSQDRQRVTVGTMKTECKEKNLHKNKNTKLTKLNKIIKRINIHKRINTKTQ
jgi:hypothetical protein